MEYKIKRTIESFIGGVFLLAGLFLIFPVRGINIIFGIILIGFGVIQFWGEIKKEKILTTHQKEKYIDTYIPTPEIKKAQLRAIVFKNGIETARNSGGSNSKYIDDLIIYEDMSNKAWDLVYKQYPKLKGKDLTYDKTTNLITVIN